MAGIRRRIYWTAIISITGFTFFLNICAWLSPEFSDTYRKYVFPLWGSTLGRFSDLFSFSLGELMIVSGLVLLAVFVISVSFYIVMRLLRRNFSSSVHFIRFFRVFLFVLSSLALVMTLNCFIIYHCNTFSDEYFSESSDGYSYSYFELASVRDYVVDQVNTLSLDMQRDEDGNVIYNGTEADMKAEAIASMKNLGSIYPELSGHYNTPKALYFSDFMSQQSVRGYYFPFSMESNYNNNMTTVNKPSTMCHELAHTKGFIYEDEANLIAYLACVNSDDEYFRYSGYLSILNYLDNDFKTACGKGTFIYNAHPAISSLVRSDNVFLTASSRKSMEKNAVVPTKAVKKAANTFINTNLIVNGIPDGELSYCRVVGLVLDYYDGSDTMQYDSYLFADAAE